MKATAVRPLPPAKRAGAFAAVMLVRALMASWRPVWHFPRNFNLNGPSIWCVWHNRIAISMLVYNYLKPRTSASGLAALISASEDGSFLAYVLKHFDVQAARGSSSRRGPQALREALAFLEKNYHVAITPDGPKGPKYTMHDGVISLAQLSGCPVYPVSTFVKSKVSLKKSWDALQIPLPFAKVHIHIGEPIAVPPLLDEDQRSTYKKQLLETMQRLTKD